MAATAFATWTRVSKAEASDPRRSRRARAGGRGSGRSRDPGTAGWRRISDRRAPEGRRAPRACCRPIAVADRASASAGHDGGLEPQAGTCREAAEDEGRDGELGEAEPEDVPPHRPEMGQLELQADDEQEQHDPEFRHAGGGPGIPDQPEPGGADRRRPRRGSRAPRLGRAAGTSEPPPRLHRRRSGPGGRKLAWEAAPAMISSRLVEGAPLVEGFWGKGEGRPFRPKDEAYRTTSFPDGAPCFGVIPGRSEIVRIGAG